MGRLIVTRPVNMIALIRSSFNKEEIAYLCGHPKFRDALANTRNAGDYDRLCAVGEELVSQRGFAARPPQSGASSQ